MKRFALSLFLCLFTFNAFSQEALKSTEEEYYDFLSLMGKTERPTLNYRTLSDSEWNFTEENPEHPWKDNKLGSKFTLWSASEQNQNWFTKGVNQDIKLKIYGPDWFNSYNTASPYGQNDGALWQGKGYNTSLTAGARLEAFGFEVTVKPMVCFSENREFEYITPNYTSDESNGLYLGKASIFGYYGVRNVDAPQRFGDKSFWTFDWGDTEVRYSWHTFTIGFGTQSPWIGPAQLNPIIHSNNASSYPKFDIGLRKTSLYMPHFGWHLGDIELRGWWGKLTESDWFDNDSENDNNLITVYSIAYSLPYINSLTLGFNKVCISKWNDFSLKRINPFYSTNEYENNAKGEDQKASFTFDWIMQSIGFEIYGEICIDDYLHISMTEGLKRYPFDSMGFTAGLKKDITINREKSIFGQFYTEFTWLDEPTNRKPEAYSFNSHGLISQGYTNKGQCLGTSLGMGGNSQLMGFNLYYPKGKSGIVIERRNPDNTYSYVNVGNYNETYKAYFSISANSCFYILKNLYITCSIKYVDIINNMYFEKKDDKILSTPDKTNFYISNQIVFRI